MAKYFNTIDHEKEINIKSGSNIDISSEMKILSSSIIAQSSFVQNLIQNLIFTTHSSVIFEAKKTLKKFPNPKARFSFISNYNYNSNDKIVDKVFSFVQSKFDEAYDLRNTLAHEVWSSSEAYPGEILFSSLDEQSRLSVARGKVKHLEDATALEAYNAAIRFIRKIRRVSVINLADALADLNLCAWILMQIDNIREEKDGLKREELRKGFLIFKATSHLFPEVDRLDGVSNYTNSLSKTINK